MDINSHDVTFEIDPSEASTRARSVSHVETYSMSVEGYSLEDGIQNLTAIDENGDVAYSTEYKKNPKLRFAAAIPVWWGLSEAAVKALLASLGVIEIGAFLAILLDEIESKFRKSGIDYIEARLQNNNVYVVGEPLTYGQAFTVATKNSSKGGVLCKKQNMAYNLALRLGGGAVPIGPNIHGEPGAAGQFLHYHAKYDFTNSHIWYT